MGLAEYRRKRDFQKTSEPRGAKQARRGKLRFVVQKHDASHLHYDFRLELDGVLKSWAVPKGPSLDPAQKRLAVEVEDHPLEYGKFEGTIPEGEYGGGTVLLWDRGTWEPTTDPHQGLSEGMLKFELHGEKLRGGWTLVRTRGRGASKPQWLLIKERDSAVRPADQFDVTVEEPLSVASHRDLGEISAGTSRTWSSTAKAEKVSRAKSPRKRAPVTKKAGTKKAGTKSKPPARGRGAKAPPDVVKPELATLVREPPGGDEWLHEIKFDGYRILAHRDGDEVRLVTRRGVDWTDKMPEIAGAISRLRVDQAVFDGEIVALNRQGVSEFQLLQNAIHDRRRGGLVYYIFDLLWLDGRDLRPMPLAERKQELEALRLPVDRGAVRMVEHVQGHGPTFFAEAERMGLEGTISKRVDRPYRSGRGLDWLKVKCQASAEFVIGGYTDPEGARHDFGALLLGYYEDGELRYAGRVGTGFDEKSLSSLGKKLKVREVDHSPFTPPKIQRERHAHWVRPELVGQIRYSNWTHDGLLRQPVFLGLREDKPPRSVHRELPATLNSQRNTKPKPARKQKPARGAKRAAATPAKAAATPCAEAALTKLSHPERIYFPEPQLTKRDLAEYYLAVAQWMLPHVADRAITIVRCPGGVTGPRFFQKHPGPGTLESLGRVAVKEKDKTDDYAVVRQATDLVELAQIGALEIHIWGSRVDALETPDQMIFDLDPAPEVSWGEVVKAGREIHDLLAELELTSFVKTSGGKGLHVVVPISRRHEWDVVARFCRGVAQWIARANPARYVATMSKAARRGKIFVDYLRNQRGATTVAAYSTRASAQAAVSMPVTWEALSTLDGANHFRVANALAHLAKRKRDPWAETDGVQQSLTARAISRMTDP